MSVDQLQDEYEVICNRLTSALANGLAGIKAEIDAHESTEAPPDWKPEPRPSFIRRAPRPQVNRNWFR